MTVVVCMIGYWIYKYEIEDRDIGVVDYALVKEIPEDIKMPVVSVCLRDPFLQMKLSKINDSIDTTAYKDYLKGNLKNSALDQIDYKNVTLHLRDYLTYSQELWVNESAYRNNSRFVDHKVVFDGFYREDFLRCFLLKSEMESHLETILLTYNQAFLFYVQYGCSLLIEFKSLTNSLLAPPSFSSKYCLQTSTAASYTPRLFK